MNEKKNDFFIDKADLGVPDFDLALDHIEACGGPQMGFAQVSIWSCAGPESRPRAFQATFLASSISSSIPMSMLKSSSASSSM